MSAGRFISLEGGEGAGKSTQARLLADAIKARGHHVVVTREPGGSSGAEAIRTLLMTGEVARWSAHAEALLFAAARADHVETLIRPTVDAGSWVICDRFVDSTRAYQGAQGIDDAAILALHGFGARGLLPDRTLVLALPAEVSAARVAVRDGGATDRFARRDATFHAAVAEIFCAIAAREPDRVRLIDGAGAPEVVTQRLIAALADLM